MDVRHRSMSPTKTLKASGSGSREEDTHPGTHLHFTYYQRGLAYIYCTIGLWSKWKTTELNIFVYSEQNFPVVVSANISMYALGMPSLELEVPKLINCLHFHPVREDRQEKKVKYFQWKMYINKNRRKISASSHYIKPHKQLQNNEDGAENEWIIHSFWEPDTLLL